MTIREDAQYIMDAALKAAMPDAAVAKALKTLPECRGRLVLIALGKAGWQMASAAWDALGSRIQGGVVCTKYGHSMGPIGCLTISEGGHPVPDEASYRGTQLAIDAVADLTADDLVLLLISGGGSALFEKPLLPAGQLEDITSQLLACGADIVEINTLRKRFSAVKGGRFAQLCAPAQVFSVVLSDVLGDPLDMIASGPAYPDASTSRQALEIAKKYDLKLSRQAWALLEEETPKTLSNVTTQITGSVSQLCAAAMAAARERGYNPMLLTDRLCCQAKEAGSFLGAVAQSHRAARDNLAYVVGGETVVKLIGKGKGGRNQELALSAAQDIAGMENVVVFSLGSDGTDGPTDAAGGIVDGTTAQCLESQGIYIHDVLQNNDAYHALERCGGLIITGPTGTNVNDLSMVLIKGKG